MPQNNTTGTQGASTLEELATQGDVEAKRESARQLMEGDGVDKDEAKAVSLLEDCVARGDADAMVMLAKCYALGHGIEHNAERAEALVSEAAEKGNDEARILLQLINDWKGKTHIDLGCLKKCFLTGAQMRKTHACVVFAGRFRGQCAIERVALVMNIVPCPSLSCNCYHQRQYIVFITGVFVSSTQIP